MDNPTIPALTGFVSQVLPEIVLGLAACVLFLGSTWKASRQVWGVAALVSLLLAAAALAWVASTEPTMEARVAALNQLEPQGDEVRQAGQLDQVRADASSRVTHLTYTAGKR